jgi:DNA ligase-1
MTGPLFVKRWCRRCILALLLACLAPTAWPGQGGVPALMLANLYRADIDLSAYWVSEKYDGVRGYWNGEQLVTRGGNPVRAPSWFTAGWPKHPMDGELWAGRGRFESAVSTVRTETPDDAAWREMRYMVFDLPAHEGTFDERIPALRNAVSGIAQPWVKAVEQRRFRSHDALKQALEKVVQDGGEGLMLHRGASRYQGFRNNDLLKLKLFDDAESEVIQHLPGKGKYKGLLGSLLVKTPDGRVFKLGSGLSDALRHTPPPLGAWVTYRYRGTHESGLPRFASFLRVRTDAALNGSPESPNPQSR